MVRRLEGRGRWGANGREEGSRREQARENELEEQKNNHRIRIEIGKDGRGRGDFHLLSTHAGNYVKNMVL